MTKFDIIDCLININAVQINPQNPFTFASGISSPIYCDNRLLISYPTQRRLIIDRFIDIIDNKQLQFDIIGGTATAGIPHAAWLAERLDLPMIYVRSSNKAHGKQNQIEGATKAGQRVLLIEDLISTGSSLINAAQAIRAAGLIIDDCLAIFNYQLTTAASNLENANVNAYSCSNFSELLAYASSKGEISAAEIKQLQQWQNNPEQWQRK